MAGGIATSGDPLKKEESEGYWENVNNGIEYNRKGRKIKGGGGIKALFGSL